MQVQNESRFATYTMQTAMGMSFMWTYRTGDVMKLTKTIKIKKSLINKLSQGGRIELNAKDSVLVPGQKYSQILPDGTECFFSTSSRYLPIDIKIVFIRDKSKGKVTRRE